MHAGLHIRALLPTRGAPQIRKRPQDIRRQQRNQAPQRPPPTSARGRRQLPSLRGRGSSQGPRLRLRGSHLLPSAPSPPPPERARRRQCRPRSLRL
ncbi:hypothetical protein LINGRAHAP2_LOCUS21283 [Linum grandiflorum]